MPNKQQDKQYQEAFQEWNDRIGSARNQMRNWRLACIISLLVAFLLILAIVIVLFSKKNYVYVAEVKPNNNIVNVQPMSKTYKPTEAQKEYFIYRFIRNIMSLPLDPVVVRKNWNEAYQLASGKATLQLNEFARANAPFSEVGKLTKVIEIKHYNPIGNNSFDFTWKQTVYNQKGTIEKILLYNGIFTIVDGQKPQTVQDMLVNPLGLKIVYFSITQEGQ